MEIRELLGEYGYDAEETPVVIGSARCALEGQRDDIGKESILKLMEAVDEHIPTPERDTDKPALMSIEGVRHLSLRQYNISALVNCSISLICQLMCHLFGSFTYTSLLQTYSIQGRGTVVSGRLEQGTLKKDDKIEILGHNQVIKSAITGYFDV